MKNLRIRYFSGPYFPAFGLNTERYSVFSPNAGKKEPEKQQTRTFFTHESGVFVIFEHISYLVLGVVNFEHIIAGWATNF